MLESKQSVNFAYCLDFSILNFIRDLVKRGMGDLLYFLLPEDTSDDRDLGARDLIGGGESNTRGTAKALFWLVASITVTLLLGQLQ